MTALRTSYLTLMSTPLAATFLSWAVSRQTAQRQQWLLAIIAALVVLTVVAIVAGISLSNYEAGVLTLAMAYLGFGVLALSAFRIRPRAVGVPFGVVASLPLATGYLLGQFGGFGLMIIFEHTDPIYVGNPTPEVTCYVNTFGNAITLPQGYEVAIKRKLWLVPFLEVADRKLRFETESDKPGFTPTDACTRAYAEKG